ncbi:hypothetical protein V7S43_010088 [Phytophthora oleae]|uniref:Uncharacterized protein n=1 Tax=Phytophthora oleae TaxID=2107226 RepID=A0ABD3FET2_9STRA
MTRRDAAIATGEGSGAGEEARSAPAVDDDGGDTVEERGGAESASGSEVAVSEGSSDDARGCCFCGGSSGVGDTLLFPVFKRRAGVTLRCD